MSKNNYESLNEAFSHSVKKGDAMIKNYGNKVVKFSFVFNKNGKSLKEILEDCYRQEIRNEQLLVGGK